jgi:hypothetical protein
VPSGACSMADVSLVGGLGRNFCHLCSLCKKLRTSVGSRRILFVGLIWIFVSSIRSFVGVGRLFVRAK